MKGARGPRGFPGKCSSNYIKAVEFQDFCKNQNTLIDILNHRMTSIEMSIIQIKSDVGWTKKILWGIFGVISVSLITILIRSAFG